MRTRIDGMTLAGLAILLLFAVNITRNWAGGRATSAAPAAMQAAVPETVPAVEPPAGAGGEAPGDDAWHTMTGLPYDTYFLTQGIHGLDYGHMAIDIAAGNGAAIKSIINGTVTGTGYDQWGNTFIQIENDVYTVLYLHGIYTLIIGDPVSVGQIIGTESNIGYTLDMAGNLCAGRDCGYHTHLNVFDKRLGANIDPLTLIPPAYP